MSTSKRNRHYKHRATNADRLREHALARRMRDRELPPLDDGLARSERAARLYATRSRTGSCRAARRVV